MVSASQFESLILARVAEWQTRKIQDLVGATPWRFKSSLAHSHQYLPRFLEATVHRGCGVGCVLAYASDVSASVPAPKPNPQQVARAGEHLVAAELHRRGAYAVTFAGNMPRIDILASNVDQTRTVMIQVKTKRTGSWQTSTRAGIPREAVPEELHFWVFVDLRRNPNEPPIYYVVPEWWIQNDIHDAHERYLAGHAGRRARTPDSTHHAIRVRRIAEWEGRWDLLGIC